MAPERDGDAREALRSTIVEAASRLLADRGAHAVTTRAVAELAGVQAPAIYRLFGDKSGLIDAVAEHVMQSYVADKTAWVTASGEGPVEELRVAWQGHVQFGLTNADLYALLNTPGRVSRSPATAAGIEVLRTRIRRIAAAGLLRVDVDRAVDMVHAAGAGAVLTLLGMPEAERDLGLADAMFDVVADGILAASRSADDATVPTAANTFMAVLPDLPGLTDAERALMAEWVTRALTRMRPA